MRLQVQRCEQGHQVVGDGPDVDVVNAFLSHLVVRGFAAATVRAYAYDLVIFLRFAADAGLTVAGLVPGDVFDFLEWQTRPRATAGRTVVRLAEARGAAPATMNRRIAALRGLMEYVVIIGVREDNPVPAARRAGNARPRGLLGHVRPARPRTGGRLVRQPRRLPDSLTGEEVAAFLTDLDTYRDRAMTLVMLLGGLRAGEVRSLRLADVDQGRRRVRVVGKGGKERVVPVDGAFFVELAADLRCEQPAGCTTAECFVVLRGPTTGEPLTEAGLRRIFRTHRARSGATRVPTPAAAHIRHRACCCGHRPAGAA